MKKFFRNLFYFILIGGGLVLLVLGIKQMYVSTNSTNAIKYLSEKYEIDKKNIKPIKFTKYIYEDIANCESLWFKKCTSDSRLVYTYEFIINGEKIIVSEDIDGVLTDDWNKESVDKEVNDNNSDKQNSEANKKA